MRILLQFPEGLKSKALAEALTLEKQGHEVFVSSAPCYGACDIALEEARSVGAKKIIHYAHAQFGTKKKFGNISVEFREWRVKIEPDALKAVLGKAKDELKSCGKIALVTTVQHVGQLPEIKSALERMGKKVLIGKGTKAQYPGQILGCDDNAAVSVAPKADCVLYFGGGQFHPTGIRTEKPVLHVNPYSGEVKWLTDEIKREEKRELAALIKASEGKVFGVLVSTKSGQFNLAAGERAKKEIEKKGRRAVLLVSNEINPMALANFNIFDAYINTACPRLIEDRERFGKPLVNVARLKELLELMQ